MDLQEKPDPTLYTHNELAEGEQKCSSVCVDLPLENEAVDTEENLL